MTPCRLRDCLAALHWSQRALAGILDRDERRVRRWASGDGPVPPEIAEWLEKLARFHEANPPPPRASFFARYQADIRMMPARRKD